MTEGLLETRAPARARCRTLRTPSLGMAPFAVSAPGKAFLIGEYAVLEGADAVVMAVSRRVVLRRAAGRMRPLVARARHAAAESLGCPDLAATPWNADSSALYHERRKLGLGSSAAVVVGAVASVFHESGEAISSPEVRQRIREVARGVHDSFQRTVGSGADIAASVLGGYVVLRRGAQDRTEFSAWRLAPGVRLAFLWSGRPASTRAMLRAVRRLRAAQPRAYERLIADMAIAARGFAREGRTDARVVFDAAGGYGRLMDRLGRLAGVPIVSPFAAAVDRAARRFGGAAKPSGAGGGDIVVVALPEDADIEAFRAAIGPKTHVFLDLDVDPCGVRVDPAPRSGEEVGCP